MTKKPVEDPFNLETAGHAITYPRGGRRILELGHGMAFVVNISRIAGESSGRLDLASGHVLRRANKKEIKAVRDVCKDYGISHWSAWQCVRLEDGQYQNLPTEEWRYFVISFKGSNDTIVEIERALCIAPCEIKIGFTLLTGPFRDIVAPTLVFDPGRLFHLLRSVGEQHPPFVEVTQSDVDQVEAVRGKIRGFDEAVISVKGLIQQMLDLEALPHQSSLLFLGYFAILESLLTHQPKKTDTIDSITRQIIKKLQLLDNRWKPRIDYAKFQGAKPPTIWSTMYNYRSALAHGGSPDFKGDLQLLGDSDSALILLRQTVKSVLRQVLIEPQLIVDLRSC